MIVLLGSTRPAKVEGAREALDAIAAIDTRFAHFTLHAVDLTAIAPRMPLTESEILRGARLRASALLEHATFVAGQTLAIGLEGGLSRIDVGIAEPRNLGTPEPRNRGTSEPRNVGTLDCWTLQTWAAVSDGECWGYGAGGAFTVPDSVVRRVLAGEELGDIIDSLVGASVRGTRGAWGVLTRDLVSRRDAFRLAVIAALTPFFNAGAY